MALWTDLIDPVELTAEAREAADAAEAQKGSLARYLPSVEVDDIVIEVFAEANGLIEEAQYRAFNAEPELAGGDEGSGFTIKLPALGQKRFITEYMQLRNRNAGDDTMRASIVKHARAVAVAIVSRMERQRAIALLTGKTTITGRRFNSEDDFGRDPGHSVTAAVLWADPSVSRLADLEAWVDAYVTTNGVEPGSIVMSKRVLRALAAGDEFSTQLLNGSNRRAAEDEVRSVVTGAGLPDIELYDRRTDQGLLVPNDTLLLLPAPGETRAEEANALGASFWGRTLTSMETEYEIAEAEQPGIVVGAHKNESVPHNAFVDSDAIGLPVLSNANLSFVAKVL
ncbi:major capsid protein [Zhihengliuella halotolerans]|uniref:major capsid protein n=1 Tax=Zhihengliuella halotolerans TaxID=370736 RepID=UPI000C80BC3F|nr:major capsid protein [Zhihengliuella halotolerans]